MGAIPFKERVLRDRAIFLNIDQLGELHMVEGKQITIAIDSDRLIERQGGTEVGVAESTLLFFAKVEDLPQRKAPGSVLNVDGREYTVDSWGETFGIAQIALGQIRTI
jgi:hypothetical protein